MNRLLSGNRLWIVWAGTGLALGLGLAWLAGALSGARTPKSAPTEGFALISVSPSDGKEAAATTGIDLVFTQPADLDSLKAHWTLSPDVGGSFQSAGDQVRFVPASPFPMGQRVSVTVSAGLMSEGGTQLLDESSSWMFVIRPPTVVFLSPSTPPHAVMSSGTKPEDRPEPLLPDKMDVQAFRVSPGGDRLALVIGNDAGGHDVWTVDSDGSRLTPSTDCGPDACDDPVWLPDRIHLAYTRTGSDGSSTVWIQPLAGGAPTRLLDDPQLRAKRPTWSPDGSKVAFSDLGDGTMRVHDFISDHDLRFHTLNGLVGSWSPDGSQMVVNVLDISQEPPLGILYVIDASSGAASEISVPGLVDFGEPVWSPDGHWIAVSARAEGGGPDRGMWLVDPVTADTVSVAVQPGSAFGGPVWDPWGASLVFQGASVQALDSFPNVFLWRMGETSPTELAADAFAPAWIP